MVNLRETLLGIVPDSAPTLDLRALLLDARTELFGTTAGAVVKHAGHHLIWLFGTPGFDLVVQALGPSRECWTVLAPDCRDDLIPNGHWKRVTLMRLAEPAAVASVLREAEQEVVALSRALLADVPVELVQELGAVLAQDYVVCAIAGGRPVSFAYVPMRTETLFDISVDTIEEFRGRGFARRCAAVLIDRERRTGREPVWGVLDSNMASQRAARALGFAPVDHVWMAEPD